MCESDWMKCSALYLLTCGSAVSALFLCTGLRSRLHDDSRRALAVRERSKSGDALILGHMTCCWARSPLVHLEAKGRPSTAVFPGVRLRDSLSWLQCTADQTQSKQTNKQTHWHLAQPNQTRTAVASLTVPPMTRRAGRGGLDLCVLSWCPAVEMQASESCCSSFNHASALRLQLGLGGALLRERGGRKRGAAWCARVVAEFLERNKSEMSYR